jgi:hypothetical protein
VVINWTGEWMCTKTSKDARKCEDKRVSKDFNLFLKWWLRAASTQFTQANTGYLLFSVILEIFLWFESCTIVDSFLVCFWWQTVKMQPRLLLGLWTVGVVCPWLGPSHDLIREVLCDAGSCVKPCLPFTWAHSIFAHPYPALFTQRGFLLRLYLGRPLWVTRVYYCDSLASSANSSSTTNATPSLMHTNNLIPLTVVLRCSC